MNLLNVDTVSEARDKLAAFCEHIAPEIEICGLIEAAGRILAADCYSAESVPPYRRSTVDGYAVRSRELGAAGDMIPTVLRITGEVVLGSDPSGVTVAPGSCVYVPTGGAVPEGADAVVMVEYCETFGGGMLAVSRPAAPGENVVQIGEDMQTGELLVRRGRKLRPQDIGALAGAGVSMVPVFKPWSVTVISTGDELVPPDAAPGPGQIRDINTYTVAARSLDEGFRIVRTVSVRDDREAIRRVLEQAKRDSDVVVLSGGSSKGKKDMTADLIGETADCGVLTHGIAAKPGKPTITGFDGESGTLFIGLPGHPAAALMVYEQVLIRLWRDLTEQPEERTVCARISANVQSAPGRRTFQLVRLTDGTQDGELPEAEPVLARSGMIAPMSAADGYFEMSENQEGVRAGDLIRVRLWK